MIPKWVAIMFMWVPLTAFAIFRFVMEPRLHKHITVQDDWWMRGESYTILSLGLVYLLMTAFILVWNEGKEDA